MIRKLFSTFAITTATASLAFGQAAAPVEPLTTPATAILCAPAAEAKPPLPPYAGLLCERSTLTGDWLGSRSCLRDHGFTFDVSSTNFYQGVVDGGVNDRFRFGGRADVLLNIDGEKAGLLKGMFITLHNETLYGQGVNGFTGALSPVNTAQLFPTPNAPVNALTGVKLTQFLSEKFLVFGGKLNTLDDLRQPFAGYRGVDGFMNMNFNFPIVFGRSVPYSTYGAGFAILKDLQPVASLMVLDTNNTPTTSGFDSFFDNGASVVGTVNLPTKFFGKAGHQGLMASYSNRRYSSLDAIPFLLLSTAFNSFPNPPQQTGSWAINYSFDQTVGTIACDPKRAWGLFGNAGITDGNPNPIRWTANIGLGGASPFASRPLDSFGIAYYYLGLSENLKQLGPQNNLLGDEYGVETYYTVGVTPWCKITADLQVVNPVRKRVDTDLVIGLRAKLDF